MNVLFRQKIPQPPIDWPWVHTWLMLILLCIVLWVGIVAVAFGL